MKNTPRPTEPFTRTNLWSLDTIERINAVVVRFAGKSPAYRDSA